ncbi:MAG: class I SAM-dependent methyltransferase [Nanoarchaeota archaeon]|nr:class I SAM-dependent methyltransferase [Nanoarchaeota archaeon]
MPLQSFIENYALNTYTFTGDQEDYFIAKLIYKYMQGKRVLDLGCGPVVPVTSIFYPHAKEVVAVDILPANLNFIKKKSHTLKDNVKRALQYKKRYVSQSNSFPKITLVRGDVTKKLNIGKFDSVINLGCFGALDTPDQFQSAVNNAHSYLKKGGTLLMVNWVGKVKRPFQFNGKIHEPDVFYPSMKRAGFTIQELHITRKILSKETMQMGYTKIIWAVAKK